MRRSRPFRIVVVTGLAALAVAGTLEARGGAGHAPALSDDDRAAAGEAALMFARLVAHLQGSAGDPRFAERIRAAPDVVDEAVAAADVARRAGHVEEPRLIRAETRRVAAEVGGGAEVTTREYWITRVISADGAVVETRSDVLDVSYVVQRAPGGWDVVAWDLAAPGAEGGDE